MALGAIESNRTRPFDSCGVGSQALQGLGCDRRQSYLPVRLGWHEIPGTSWPWVGSKACNEAPWIPHHLSQTVEFDCLQSHWRPWNAWYPAPSESNGRVRLPSKAIKRLGSHATRVKPVSSVAFDRTQAVVSLATRVEQASSIGFDRTQGHEAPWIPRHPNRTGEFDCLWLHPGCGISRHPSRTGEFNWIRSHPRPWSAWDPAPPESNGRVRLPSIAPKAIKRLGSRATRVERERLPPKAMKRLGSRAARVERASSIAFDRCSGLTATFSDTTPVRAVSETYSA